MLALNWEKFRDLTDDPRACFESLCRAIIHFRFARFGRIRSLANQPGVECHLQLDESCELGDKPRWWGWQCKWFELNALNRLSSTQRAEIESSLRISEKELPNLTDWVLWTRKELSKNDATWFDGLVSRLKLHRWDHTNIATYLADDCAMLQRTYFGDLVLTPHRLKLNHAESVAKIAIRWLPGLHQATSAEREIRQMTGELLSWLEGHELAERLRDNHKVIQRSLGSVPNDKRDSVQSFLAEILSVVNRLNSAEQMLSIGTHAELREFIDNSNVAIAPHWESVPRLMRFLNLPIAINTMNALADMGDAHSLLIRMNNSLQIGLVAVIAQAGGGKTQMAAQLSDSNEFRPAGILLHGHDLRRGQGLNDLAKTYQIDGSPCESMEGLISALDATAQRVRRRLPLVIDGLNEAENPRDWQPALSGINVVLQRYPNVLMVCTLRTGSCFQEPDPWHQKRFRPAADRDSFALEALPQGVKTIESEGFGGDVWEAIDKYFTHFKINTHEAEIPSEFLSHPLHLRLFCEAINPEAETEVVVESFPPSFALLMGKYVSNAAERITKLKNLIPSYRIDDVKRAVLVLGRMWWQSRSGAISQKHYRTEIGDDRREWGDSLVNLLVQQGIILRHMTKQEDDHFLLPSYDLLGGYIIADSIFKDQADSATMEWVKKPDFIEALFGESRHAMQTDVLRSLVALTPRSRPGQQFWKWVSKEAKPMIILMTAVINATDIDAATVEEVKAQLFAPTQWQTRMLDMLRQFRSSKNHPLNSSFLHSQLSILSVADRDLSWSEWLRSHWRERRTDLDAIENRWLENSRRTESDRLRAQWVMWLLTSTDREFRDLATRALYRYGREDVVSIFDLALTSLSINDPYIPERVLAAAYGVAMAKHADIADEAFHDQILPKFARNIYEAMLAPEAQKATPHCLMREYACRIVELANYEKSGSFTATELKCTVPPFKHGDLRKWGVMKDSLSDGSPGNESPFEMDFENYTIGSLVPGRSAYDFNHKGYLRVRAQIRWRVDQLGWKPERFSTLDNNISRAQRPTRHRLDSKAVECYGQKYSQIAYAEMHGLRFGKKARDDWRERTSEVDIDPSFPARVTRAKHFAIDMLGESKISTTEWMKDEAKPNLEPFLKSAEIAEQIGPWTILDAYISQEDEERGRKLFCFVRTFFVATEDADNLKAQLEKQNLGGRWLPEKPNVIYTFGGEIPWCSSFPENESETMSFKIQMDLRKTLKKRESLCIDGVPITAAEITKLMANLHSNNSSAEEVSSDDLKRISWLETETEVEEPFIETHEFNVHIPVRDFDWEGHQSAANDSGHATMLAKGIAHDLGLVGKPQSFDLFCKDGSKATLCTRHGDQLYKGENLFAIRDDLLQYYLKKHGLAMIWAVWGEREYSGKVIGRWRHDGTRPDPLYANYQMIYSYSPCTEY